MVAFDSQLPDLPHLVTCPTWPQVKFAASSVPPLPL
jgi:hypothetical protein